MMWNRYVRQGAVERVEGCRFAMTYFYGVAKYDPRTPFVCQSQKGKPGELVFYIGGYMHYPTTLGYERIEQTSDKKA